MNRDHRRQFGLGALLALATIVPLWLGWAETVVERIEEDKRNQAAAAAASTTRPAVVFGHWQGAR
ncbi:hypothetical protein [Lacipirellula parvula]|uniref:Uncharacterized protein n=1 Tax=Lacipirellula parvula TaxID=2650471 RepID=A0A5K7X7A0_9BACT|nr:hypothetical protein [Lacipirellula parvula]BBO32428.1 hypothetical protein PLANPX_2040 [Lacipirellula parvula]